MHSTDQHPEPSDVDLADLQMKLLRVTDRICELVSHVTVADLMSCFKTNCRVIQDLLHERYVIDIQKTKCVLFSNAL